MITHFGRLHRMTMLLASVLASATAAASAQTYTSLHQFTGGTDGANPFTSVAYDEKGNLYGTTPEGGTTCSPYYYCGTVYKISPSGQETTLVSFTGLNGQEPTGSLTLVDHTLYGSASESGPDGSGVLFSVHTDGSKFKLLHSFSGPDGSGPSGPLIAGPQGVFYGLTVAGGPHHANNGVLFELMPDGTYIHLHDFTGGTDGNSPATLSIDAAGTLYGSTTFGLPCNRGCGSVYTYVPASGIFNVLQQFTPHDGVHPMVGSIGPDGTIYGATDGDGPQGGGTLFQFAPVGGSYTYTKLYAFSNQYPFVGAGYSPSGGPILTSYGALIGTTGNGNESLYKFKSNRMSVLYSFPRQTSAAPPTLDKNGTIYGATTQGGIEPCVVGTFSNPLGCGFVYSFLRAAP